VRSVYYCYSYHTLLGWLTICADEDTIFTLSFEKLLTAADDEAETPLIREAYRQLTQYFTGKLRSFDLPLNPQGTIFQLHVWQALVAIPYGQTKTYGQIAAEISKPKAGRAVGMANNRNPLPILIPCHRVIGANGSLTGYVGGLTIKQTLLDLEKRDVVF
jgi:methylated-DNA-[protein]-cysteine S-methyltransferase